MRKIQKIDIQHNSSDSHPFVFKDLLKPGIISILFHFTLLFFLIQIFQIGRTDKDHFVCQVTLLPAHAQDSQPFFPPVEDKEIIKKPVPLPMSSKPLPDQNIKPEKQDVPIIPLPPSSVESTTSKLSSGDKPEEGPGGTGSGGSINGKESAQGGIQLGEAGGGTEMNLGSPAFGNSENGTGTGIGLGSGNAGTAHPRYYFNPKPEYPPEAIQKRQEGKVLLKVEVLPNGQAGEILVEKSSGYEYFDQSALDGVKIWRFIPAMKGKMFIPSWTIVMVNFQLKNYDF